MSYVVSTSTAAFCHGEDHPRSVQVSRSGMAATVAPESPFTQPEARLSLATLRAESAPGRSRTCYLRVRNPLCRPLHHESLLADPLPGRWWRNQVPTLVCRSHGFTGRWACRRPLPPWGPRRELNPPKWGHDPPSALQPSPRTVVDQGLEPRTNAMWRRRSAAELTDHACSPEDSNLHHRIRSPA